MFHQFPTIFHQFPTPIPRLPKGVEVVVVLLAGPEDAMVPREAHVAGPSAEAQHLGVVAHLRDWRARLWATGRRMPNKSQ